MANTASLKQYYKEIENKCCVCRGVKGVPAPIPQEGEWTKCKEIKDISGLTHGCGCCAPQQGTCKLTLNVKEGIIQEALVETIGCSTPYNAVGEKTSLPLSSEYDLLRVAPQCQ